MSQASKPVRIGGRNWMWFDHPEFKGRSSYSARLEDGTTVSVDFPVEDVTGDQVVGSIQEVVG